MLRSLTVQERIRELNLRARMFTDTMLAIKGSTRLSHPRRVVAKSLQVRNSPIRVLVDENFSQEKLVLRQIHEVE